MGIYGTGQSKKCVTASANTTLFFGMQTLILGHLTVKHFEFPITVEYHMSVVLILENKQLHAVVEEREITLGRQIDRILELENHLKQHGVDV